jgi:hypothetical protein
MSGTELIRYDAMCSAIAAAYQVDEVKDIRDKALAIEIYARQARNTEAETRAGSVRPGRGDPGWQAGRQKCAADCRRNRGASFDRTYRGSLDSPPPLFGIGGVLYASFNPAPRLPRNSRPLAVSMNPDLGWLSVGPT